MKKDTPEDTPFDLWIITKDSNNKKTTMNSMRMPIVKNSNDKSYIKQQREEQQNTIRIARARATPRESTRASASARAILRAKTTARARATATSKQLQQTSKARQGKACNARQDGTSYFRNHIDDS